MRVLVAHGDETARRELVGLVGRLGHDSVACGDDGGDAAWQAATGAGVDVVLCDGRSGAGDGIDLCRRLRHLDDDRYPYVIVLTDDADHGRALDFVRAGADDHLVHPPAPAALEARLVVAERITDLHRQLAERRSELRRLNDELQQAVRTDPLTGLFNRRRLEEDEPILDEGLRRYDRPFTVAMLDVDHFKAYNDRHGHPAGDDVLRRLSASLRATMRQSDLAYRYGGEEFLLVFPVRGLGSAKVAADRARVGVEKLAVPHPGTPHGIVTVSLGVAEASPADGLAGAIAAADAALYEAKGAGRNRVVVAPPRLPTDIRLA